MAYAAALRASPVTYVPIDLTAGSPSPYRYDVVAGGISGGRVAGQGRVDIFSGIAHALLWETAAAGAVPIDLHPAGYDSSLVTSIAGDQQVGNASRNNLSRAILWRGTAAGAVDLTPAGSEESVANATSGTQQVGYVGAQTGLRATLWSGTAASAVDLQPAGYRSSQATGIWGPTQVGLALLPDIGYSHAMRWSGTAASVVDLHPAGYESSAATDIVGSQVVGWAERPGSYQAMLWTGDASTAVNLNPTQWRAVTSQANATNGTHQVGMAYLGDLEVYHAVLWSGTADSALDLGALLPAEYGTSVAEAIDEAGNVAGFAIHTPSNTTHAVVWLAVPEPTAALLLPCAAAAALLRRPRCRA